MTLKYLGGLFLFGLLGLSSVIADQRNPNIVIILVDDMGYGDPGCFNSDSKIATPHIDSIASEGMRFTDAHAPGPLCHMSRYGLLTGTYPFRIDVTKWPSTPLIRHDQMTIASLAKSQGYRTAMVGKWHVGFNEVGYDKPFKGGPIDRGFDSFFGMRASTDIPPYFYIRDDRVVQPPTEHIDDEFSSDWSKIQGRRRLAGGISPDMNLEDVLPRFTKEAIRVIENHSNRDQQPGQPLLLYLAYPAPHTPWLPSPEFLGKSGASLYGDFVMMVDDQVGQVLEALRQANMADETLLIFTSDNGPCWHEEDIKRFAHDAAGGLRGMKADAWEGGHRMPFIVRWPGNVEANSQSNQLICFTDLLATFAAMMKVALPADAGPDSFSFLPVLKATEEPSPPLRSQFVMRPGSSAEMMMIRSGDWKLITGLGSGGFSQPKFIKPKPGEPEGQLYNLAVDLGEKNNLYAQRQDVVARLMTELQQIVDDGHRQTIASVVDRSTLNGKVMVGYQGWFNCENDGANLGWTHWARNRNEPFEPGNVTVDLWPDVSELETGERYRTGFVHTDGKIGEVFSSGNRKTVSRHFQWMRDYGIDGAFVQRFANGLKQPISLQHKDRVLSHAREGANRYGRAFAVMYDLSGLGAGEVRRVQEDWSSLQEANLTGDPAYLHHEGKPVVAVWGIGFNDGRKYSLGECVDLVNWLKAQGCTVMLGVPSFWRDGKRDAISDPQLHEILKQADIVSPWSIGRYRTPEEATLHAAGVWQADHQWCNAYGIDLLPVVYPGFSWHNLKGAELDSIPRLKGEFLWSQVVGAKRTGCNMLYVAMFDEVDEGTAIFKCTNDPPTGNGGKFLTYEGLPSDHYLRIVEQAGKLFRDEISIKEGALPFPIVQPANAVR